MTDTPAPTIQQHFEEAKREHSAEAERAAASAKPEPVEAVPQANEAIPEPSPAVTGTTETADDLISDAELAALQTQHASDPAALAKELKGVFTKKTQALAAQRKALDRITPYQELILQLEDHPRETVAALAEQYGLTLAPAPAPGAPAAGAVKDPVVEQTIESFRTALGDFGFLADSLAPAVQQMAERIAKQTVDSRVAPLTERAAREQTETIFKAFETAHPDWKQFEPAMQKLLPQIEPKGMGQLDYLNLLYGVVTRERDIAETTKKAIARMTTGAQQAEGRHESRSESQIDTSAKKFSTIREAWEASKAELARR